MYFKKFSQIFGLAVLVTTLVSCSSISTSIPLISKKDVVRNSISGKPGVDGPILAVKIDDTPAAKPQAGLEYADLVYIEQVEGGLTRLAALFSSTIPERIGPVRSARITDIDLLSQFGKIAFAYSGAQRKLLPIIDQANLYNLGAQRQSSEIYINDETRRRPTAMILRADLLMNKLKDQSITPAFSRSPGWSFGPQPDTGTAVSDVKISWPANSYTAKWSNLEKRWLLYNQGQANISEAGVHLGPTTLVIQLVKITPSEYRDKVGGVTPFSETIGTGRGYVLRDGKSLEANWSRTNSDDGTHWSDQNGAEIQFEPGQIWVALTDKEPIFTILNEDASANATK